MSKLFLRNYVKMSYLCTNKIPKPITFIIANYLDFKDLIALACTNKFSNILFNDNKYWKNRIMKKLGKLPEPLPETVREWYIDNVKTFYYLENETITNSCNKPEIIAENVKYVQFAEIKWDWGDWGIHGYYVVDSFGTLVHCGKKRINVATFVDKVLECFPFDKCTLMYIDNDKNLIFKDTPGIDTYCETEELVVAENVKDVYNFSDKNIRLIYYISNDFLYIQSKISIDHWSMLSHPTPPELCVHNTGIKVKKVLHGNSKFGCLIYVDMDDQLCLEMISREKFCKRGNFSILNTNGHFGYDQYHVLVKNVKDAFVRYQSSEKDDMDVCYIDKNGNLYEIRNILNDQIKILKFRFKNVKSFSCYHRNHTEYVLFKNGKLIQIYNGKTSVLHNYANEFIENNLRLVFSTTK